MKRLFSIFVLASVALQFGCGAKQIDLLPPEFYQEVSDYTYRKEIGPYHAAIVIGSSAPAFQPSVLSAISMDYSIQHSFDVKPTPISPWVIPDPNRSVVMGER